MNRRFKILIALLAAFSIVAGSDMSAFAARKKKKTVRKPKVVTEWQWTCPRAFERRYDFQPASVNIINYREGLLMIRKRPVRRAMFVFPTLYRVMRKHIRSVVEKRYPVKDYAEEENISFEEDPMTRASAAAAAGKKKQAQDLKIFQAIKELGLKIEGLSRTRIATDEYHKVPSKGGRSTLSLEIYDGKEILDKDSTIVIVSRLDISEEAGLLPFTTKRVQGEFVTSSEFELMERLGKLYRVPFTMTALGVGKSAHNGGKPLHAYTKAWKKAKKWLTVYWAKPKPGEKKKEKLEPPEPPRRC